MNLPIENYLACFPTVKTVGEISLGTLTIGRFVLLDALGVDAQEEIREKDAVIVAYVLSGEAESHRLEESDAMLNAFERRVMCDVRDLAKAVNDICSDALRCYIKPPKRKDKKISNTKTGMGWAIDYAEWLCAEYGWSFDQAINTPLATVFALSSASLDRYNLRPNAMDYYQRKASKERKRHG